MEKQVLHFVQDDKAERSVRALSRQDAGATLARRRWLHKIGMAWMHRIVSVHKNIAELRSAGQTGASVPTWPLLANDELRSCAPPDRRGRLFPRGLCWATTSCGAALRRTDEGVCPHVAFAGRRRAAELRSAGQTGASVPTWVVVVASGRGSFVSSGASDIFICFSKN